MLRLRNGSEEFAPLVATVMMTVDRLFKSEELPDVLALYDLAMVARDPSYDTSFSRKRLVELGMLEANGRMHGSVRNIVASSLSVEGQTVKKVNPVAP